MVRVRLFLELMKRFKNIFTNQQYIYWLFLFMAALPGFFMFFTESTSLLTRIIQIILPLWFWRLFKPLSPRMRKGSLLQSVRSWRKYALQQNRKG